jgi:hypothetical protein
MPVELVFVACVAFKQLDDLIVHKARSRSPEKPVACLSLPRAAMGAASRPVTTTAAARSTAVPSTTAAAQMTALDRPATGGQELAPPLDLSRVVAAAALTSVHRTAAAAGKQAAGAPVTGTLQQLSTANTLPAPTTRGYVDSPRTSGPLPLPPPPLPLPPPPLPPQQQQALSPGSAGKPLLESSPVSAGLNAAPLILGQSTSPGKAAQTQTQTQTKTQQQQQQQQQQHARRDLAYDLSLVSPSKKRVAESSGWMPAVPSAPPSTPDGKAISGALPSGLPAFPPTPPHSQPPLHHRSRTAQLPSVSSISATAAPARPASHVHAQARSAHATETKEAALSIDTARWGREGQGEVRSSVAGSDHEARSQVEGAVAAAARTGQAHERTQREKRERDTASQRESGSRNGRAPKVSCVSVSVSVSECVSE